MPATFGSVDCRNRQARRALKLYEEKYKLLKYVKDKALGPDNIIEHPDGSLTRPFSWTSIVTVRAEPLVVIVSPSRELAVRIFGLAAGGGSSIFGEGNQSHASGNLAARSRVPGGGGGGGRGVSGPQHKPAASRTKTAAPSKTPGAAAFKDMMSADKVAANQAYGATALGPGSANTLTAPPYVYDTSAAGSGEHQLLICPSRLLICPWEQTPPLLLFALPLNHRRVFPFADVVQLSILSLRLIWPWRT
ncbi:hypothetical protein B0T24DRAFT_692771 [Lasiosphaeria ovina]|uniref:Uncharacterized protein n=1 Tax=Lasiosphaeria ovina TaxID=92902 RepID=A0AAE0JSP1_9PEZI|nr:hypothetical protein B0T24DRAFT_692771 [Lasiosphaeria ovina]